MRKQKDILLVLIVFFAALSMSVILERGSLVYAEAINTVDGAIGFRPDSSPPPPPSNNVEPGQEKFALDPETPEIRVFFREDSIEKGVTIHVFRTRLTSQQRTLSASVGEPFMFAAWVKGEGKPVDQFRTSVTIYAEYDRDQFPEGAPERLRLNMYDPVTQTWTKLCSRVDAYKNEVSGLLSHPLYLENGNSLFAVSLDQTVPVEQVVDAQGQTALSVPGNNFRLRVLPGTVEPGVHFEITTFPTIPDLTLLRLLTTPVDVKACFIDYVDPRNSRQITQFAKDMQVEFDYTTDIAARAGGEANLTNAFLHDGQWQDMETIGYRVTRSNNTVSVAVDTLGTFGLAVK